MNNFATSEWINGEGLDGLEYIFHTTTPMFLAKLASPTEVDDDMLLSTLCVQTDLNVYFDFLWLDAKVVVSDPSELLELCNQADVALEEIAAAAARRPTIDPDERMACGPFIDEFDLENPE